MPIELVWLTENYPPQRGGMAQSCDRIIRGLRSRGNLIHIVHFSDRKDGYKTTKQINGTYTAVPPEDSEAHTLNRTWHVLEQFEEATAIVCFGSHLSILGAPVFSKWFDWKLITMVRGNDFDISLFSPRKKGALNELINQSDLVVSVSELKTRKIRKLFGNSSAHTVANGIDLSQWDASKSELEFAEQWRKENLKGSNCIGLFGHLKSKKGGTFFLDALKGFALSAETHFLLVGEVEEGTVEYLDENNFYYTQLAFLDRFELIRYYLCCDVIAIPSFYDGMPNVLLEAGGLGIPVIASKIDGMADVITDGVHGQLFPPGDPEECRKAVYTFLELSPEEKQKMGKCLQKHIAQKYSINNEINRYEELFSRLADGVSTH